MLNYEISEPLEIQTIALDDAFRDKPYSEIIKLKPLSKWDITLSIYHRWRFARGPFTGSINWKN